MVKMCPACSGQDLVKVCDKWKCLYCGRMGYGIIEVEETDKLWTIPTIELPKIATTEILDDIKKRTCPGCNRVLERGQKHCAACGICVGCEGGGDTDVP